MIVSDMQATQKAEALQANPILTEMGEDEPVIPPIKEDAVSQPPVISTTDVQVRTISHCSDKKTIHNDKSNVVLAKTLELQLVKKKNVKTSKLFAK